jgi:hypothetical protein
MFSLKMLHSTGHRPNQRAGNGAGAPPYSAGFEEDLARSVGQYRFAIPF